MLQSLHVKNIALIDDVEIDFTDGLNILTGETGAGKSIIIDSVTFALGERMPKDVVRQDSDYALSELVFSVDNDRVREELANLDVMLTDDQVILQRRIVNGKSSCKVNGESVPASRIREIAEHLIDIHGQHEHQSLLHKRNHITILDSFCKEGFDDKLCKLKDAYDRYKTCEAEYNDALSSKDTVAADLDYSRFVVNEIEAADLSAGEDEELESAYTRMNNARKIAEMISGVSSALSSDTDGASQLVGYALSNMKQVADLDEKAVPLYEQLLAAEDLIGDCVHQIASYEESLDFSPEDYERIGQRLDVINTLKMKYGQTIGKINDRLAEESAKIEKLSDHEAYLAGLLEEKNRAYDVLLRSCEEVSDIRHREAKILEKDIENALNNLNFLNASFEIAIISDKERITSEGFDDVEFMISTNPGEDRKPLTGIASGGELSRIMLALKSVLAKRDEIGTMIFDEIDTGISGRTAQLVADRMAEISEKHQVIAVTHLPQIASHATTHFVIEKTAVGEHTVTNVRALSYDDSVEELARMLAGESITETVRENARELKKK